MRSSLLPRRSLRRVCDTCKQQQRNHAPWPNFSQAAALSTTAPTRIASSRQPTCTSTSLIPISRGTPTCNHIRQSRRISTSAASPAEPPTSQATQDPETETTTTPTPTPAPTKTFYDLFPQTLPLGPPPASPFAIDQRALRREFLTLQASAHPDVAPPGTSSKRRAEAVSARINEAYKTLSHPLLRAQYLLHLQGMDVANDETGRVEDPGLLMEVLETREAIEEVEAEEGLEPLRVQNEARIGECEGRLEEMFGRGDWEGARGEVVRLRYWVNVRDTIRDWERGKPVVLHH
ncbi:Co-chaperone Hsc20 [Annulohypoxylon maeteangense]|uniref:Co-chaperone Hsc20 n=1 Tax=Annulohypoxylon maeteangense TaxID=1927788 RepID=UPI002007F681|nr:Co-chaperone Hsc20 [Annulohypoxylon maeteangense]KAI0882853.1 Co-chaperone Hsc20 [Annulohypoxylon maeteangense]